MYDISVGVGIRRTIMAQATTQSAAQSKGNEILRTVRQIGATKGEVVISSHTELTADTATWREEILESVNISDTNTYFS